MLAVDDISFSYRSRTLFENLSFRVGPDEALAVQGKSGTGKSTLLSCILGLQRPSSGSLSVDGEAVTRKNAARLRREKIGMVFQSGELLSDLSPIENVIIAGLIAGLTSAEAGSRATTLLDALGVPRGDRTIGAFSGGEQQRVAVARALINQPRLLLADEPTGSLDIETRDEVIEVLRAIPSQFDCAMVIVTHDPVVASVCDDVMQLNAPAR